MCTFVYLLPANKHFQLIENFVASVTLQMNTYVYMTVKSIQVLKCFKGVLDSRITECGQITQI